MWELDHKEARVAKNWCFWTAVLQKTLESPLDCKEIQPIHSKGNQPWILMGRTDAESEAPILWPPDAKSWFIGKYPGKYPDAGKDWRQKEKRVTEMKWLDGVTVSMEINLGKLWQMVKVRESWRAEVLGVAKGQTRLGNWTATAWYFKRNLWIFFLK